MTAKNNSGIYPVRDMILVLPEEEVEIENGVIKIPEFVKQREAAAQVFGTLVAMGEGAFQYERKQYGILPVLNDGMRIMFAKYGGIVVKGKDGINYRIIRDDDILAIVDKEVRKELES
jgi:co-chaperonin GroES (HSP10)